MRGKLWKVMKVAAVLLLMLLDAITYTKNPTGDPRYLAQELLLRQMTSANRRNTEWVGPDTPQIAHLRASAAEKGLPFEITGCALQQEWEVRVFADKEKITDWYELSGDVTPNEAAEHMAVRIDTGLSTKPDIDYGPDAFCDELPILR